MSGLDDHFVVSSRPLPIYTIVRCNFSTDPHSLLHVDGEVRPPFTYKSASVHHCCPRHPSFRLIARTPDFRRLEPSSSVRQARVSSALITLRRSLSVIFLVLQSL